ncbi:glycosyltransferase family 2 protein [Pseudooceanicola sp. C21-150M6]|uniref:glycosyltransferase family 2 protein n=1 Tax=Pseudooceanicola sp. C21-150M6 TaxID=3434355 RepID=UPI003D7FDA6B
MTPPPGTWLTRLWPRPVPGASWTVVSTVAEPPALLYAFVAHYLGLGADEVHLFIDDPDQPGLAPLRAMDRVRLTICDDAYWDEVNNGVRPRGQELRQIRNASRAYRACRTDWMFFCDADEYLTARKPVAQILAGVDPKVMHCRPHMAERAFDAERAQADLFDGVLKLPLPNRPRILDAVYGGLAPLTTGGFLGHVIGKSFTRTGQDLVIRIHMPAPADPAEEARLREAKKMGPGPRLPECWLVHYDGLTPLHWRLKILRYALEYAALRAAGVAQPFAARLPARQRQIRRVHDSRDRRATFAELQPLILLDAAQQARLREAGGLLDSRPDPGAAARQLVEGTEGAPQALRFSAEAFDAALRDRRGDLIAQHGLEL